MKARCKYLQRAFWLVEIDAMNLINADGDNVWQPDDETMHQMIREALARDEDKFIILEENESGEHYLQAVPMNDDAHKLRCRVEYRDSLERRHFAADDVPLETTFALFEQYKRGDQSFRGAVNWQDISDEFEWKD